MKDIKIIENNSLKNFRMFFWWVIEAGLFSWMFSLLVLRLFSFRKTHFYYIIKDNEYVGGFTISSLPTLKYKPTNLFNECFTHSAQNLEEKGYEYFGHFIILKKYRKFGIGGSVFKGFFKDPERRIWLIPNSKETENFYITNGAELYRNCSEVILIRN